MTTTIPYCDPTTCAAAGCDPVLCVGAGLASNDQAFTRAEAAIPGGVNSSIRAFKAVGGRPYVVARADGPYVWDVEGRRYIDLVQSYGAVILGHAHPAITAAISGAAADGTSYGAPTPRETKLAETIRERVVSSLSVASSLRGDDDDNATDTGSSVRSSILTSPKRRRLGHNNGQWRPTASSSAASTSSGPGSEWDAASVVSSSAFGGPPLSSASSASGSTSSSSQWNVI